MDLIASETSRSLEISSTLFSDLIINERLAKLGDYVRGKREKQLTHRLCETEVRRKVLFLMQLLQYMTI